MLSDGVEGRTMPIGVGILCQHAGEAKLGESLSFLPRKEPLEPRKRQLNVRRWEEWRS